MKTVEIKCATASLVEFVEAQETQPVLLTIDGQPAAVLVPVCGTDAESVSLSMNPQFLAIIERSRKRHEQEGGISAEEMRRRLAMEPAKDGKPRRKVGKPKASKR